LIGIDKNIEELDKKIGSYTETDGG